MKAFKFILLFLIIIESSLCAQYGKDKSKCREVILQVADTFIKARVLIDDIIKKPSENNIYYWYSQGFINKNYGGFSGKLLHAEYYAFLKDKLVESGKFYKGVKTGRWISWYPSGRIRKRCFYKEGKLKGEYILFNEDGTIDMEGFYKNGIFHVKVEKK